MSQTQNTLHTTFHKWSATPHYLMPIPLDCRNLHCLMLWNYGLRHVSKQSIRPCNSKTEITQKNILCHTFREDAKDAWLSVSCNPFPKKSLSPKRVTGNIHLQLKQLTKKFFNLQNNFDDCNPWDKGYSKWQNIITWRPFRMSSWQNGKLFAMPSSQPASNAGALNNQNWLGSRIFFPRLIFWM